MPLTASFSRSSVLSASGGKTQFANFFNGIDITNFGSALEPSFNISTGSVVLIALALLMPAFYYIPKSVLGAVIIVASFSMIEFQEILPLWRGRSNMHFSRAFP